MNIFGITLAQSDLWLLGICGTIALTWITIRTSESIQRHSASATAYRHAFDDVILNITENPNCALARFAYTCHNGIIVAISNYRRHVPFWRRRAFEGAVDQYKKTYDMAMDYGNPYAVVLSENTEDARAKRCLYHDAILRLLSFA